MPMRCWRFAMPSNTGKRRASFIPSLPEGDLAFIIGHAAPDDRKALAQIVETSDMIRLDDGREFLLTPATPALVDRLAAFNAEAEDREWQEEDDVEVDNDSDSDNAWDGVDSNTGYAQDGEIEPVDGRPSPGDRKSSEAFRERKRDEATEVTHVKHTYGEYTNRWLRRDGFDEVTKFKRVADTLRRTLTAAKRRRK